MYFRNEYCNIADGGFVIKFDISTKSVLVNPPTLTIKVFSIYLDNIHRIASLRIFFTILIHSSKQIILEELYQSKTLCLINSRLVEQ